MLRFSVCAFLACRDGGTFGASMHTHKADRHRKEGTSADSSIKLRHANENTNRHRHTAHTGSLAQRHAPSAATQVCKDAQAERGRER